MDLNNNSVLVCTPSPSPKDFLYIDWGQIIAIKGNTHNNTTTFHLKNGAVFTVLESADYWMGEINYKRAEYMKDAIL